MKKMNFPHIELNLRRKEVLIPIIAVLVVVAILLTVGLTNFKLKGYMTEDGYALPPTELASLLRRGEGTGRVALLPVAMGEAVYTRTLGSADYYVGDSKESVSSRNPVYMREGQVLQFLDDGLSLITDEWETLSTYEGLYLSDGITFNGDNSQADIEEILLVGIENGYQVAQETHLSSAVLDEIIPMNAACAFSENEIVYYSYAGDHLEGGKISVPASAVIGIGDHEYNYQEFLRLLMAWEEKEEKKPPEEPTPTPTETPLPEDEDNGVTDSAKDRGDSENEEIMPGSEEQSGSAGGARHTGDAKPPKSEFDQPGEAIENPDAEPAPPLPAQPADIKNKDYVEPTVSFSDLSSWVYTVDLKATVSDVSGAIINGVRIFVHKVAEDGTETQVLRRVINSSGDVALGQLPPDTTYHVTAEYEYHDRLNYRQSKSFDLGVIRTLPFSELGSIAVSLRDYADNAAAAPGKGVEIFSSCVQVRDFVLTNVKNDSAPVVVGGVKSIPSGDPHKAESYINSFTLNMVRTGSSGTTEIKMESGAMNLLRAGYTLDYWNTADKLHSSSDYTFTLELKDRFGNVFPLETNKEVYVGHTCKLAPSVRITVPKESNFAGNTELDVILTNTDQAELLPNPGAAVDPLTKQVLGETGVAALYIVKEGDELTPENAVELDAYPVGSNPGSADAVKGVRFLPIAVPGASDTTAETQWIVTNLPLLKNFVACVVCGSYDILDDQLHLDETLERPTAFLTASLANLGTIVYTHNGAENVSAYRADVKFRMQFNRNDRYFNPILLTMLKEIEISLREDGETANTESLIWKKEELSRIALPLPADPAELTQKDGYYLLPVTVPVYLNGEETARMMPLTLYWAENLPRVGEEQAANVWDFLLATSYSENACWIEIGFGGPVSALEGDETTVRLFNLKQETTYVGEILTWAGQEGTEYENITSRSSKELRFTTLSRDAEVVFSDAFISADFIELYDLEFTDEDGCVLPDIADRGGNNIRVVVYDSVGREVAAHIRTVAADGTVSSLQYVCSDRQYSSLHISGLTEGETYTLRFLALQYKNGGLRELNKPLIYHCYAEDETVEDKCAYVFTTGESVYGDIELQSVSQMYTMGDGSISTDLSMLRDEDFYTGILRQYYYNYYNGNKIYYEPNPEYDPANPYQDQEPYLPVSARDVYLSEIYTKDEDGTVHTRETDLLADGEEFALEWLTHATEVYSTTTDRNNANYRSYIAIQNNAGLANINNYWATRYIHVEPGEEYVIYNTADITNFRINFYYINSAGYLQYYTYYTSGNYYLGEVFRVPAGLCDNSDRSYGYMSISGYTARDRHGMILEKYDPEKAGEDLLRAGTSDQIRYHITEGVSVNSSGGISVGTTYAYMSDFIPVSGGSVYQFTGMDATRPNLEKAKTFVSGASSTVTVCFYNSAHGFISSSAVGAQTALVKAPFGAVYCRFNMIMAPDMDGETHADTSQLSMKLYTQAVQDRYIADFAVSLEDRSDPPLMTEGSTYTVTIYQTTGTVSQTDDLQNRTGWEILWTDTAAFPEEAMNGEVFRLRDLPVNRGFHAVLSVKPAGWKNDIVLDEQYFDTCSVVHVISDYAGLLSIRNDPAGSYIVTNDITITGLVLSSDRPFSGTIDFQGHTVTCNTLYGLFHTVNPTGVIRNLNIVSERTDTSRTSPWASYGAVAYRNYGTIQNVVVHYGPSAPNAAFDLYECGAVCEYNYGTIDGFVIELTRDVRVRAWFGGVCYANYGTISNGYTCGAEVTDSHGTHTAHVVRPYMRDGEKLDTSEQYIGYIVGYNLARGTVQNVFAVNDLFVGSGNRNADNNGTYDGNTSIKDTSVSNFVYSGLLVGVNYGIFDGGFSVGDKYDFEGEDYTKDISRAVAKNRGPAVNYVNGQYKVTNLTYFSPSNVVYTTNATSATIGDYNRRGETESLYDWKWYEEALGPDGSRFNIRNMVENGDGYYPRLLLPECFADSVQPYVELPIRNAGLVELTDTQVREVGESSALVTLTLRNPRSMNITGLTLVDRYDHELSCEILAQREYGEGAQKEYRVDVLISIDGTQAIADSSYTFTGWQSGSYKDVFSLGTDERRVDVDFWQRITSLKDWETYILSKPSPIYGNYLLTEDLDFSESGYGAWFCDKNFYGKVNGGIYTTETVTLTDSAGEIVWADEEQGIPRTMESWTGLEGRHVISGIGCLDSHGLPSASRGSEKANSSCLFVYLYGTLENTIFRNFRSGPGANGENNSAINSTRSGIVHRAYYGARIENCHVEDSSFYATTDVGAILGRGDGAAVVSCSVAEDVTVSTWRYNDANNTVSVGGVCGYIDGGLVQNCFSAAYITIPDVYAANGIGGVLGYGNGVVVESCYCFGTITDNTQRVGGVVGMIAGSSYLTTCWSTTSITTVGDFAGGLCGNHSDGVISNNYTAATVVTRSLTARSVHRICNNAAYSQTSRYDNYAFADQYMTYTDLTMRNPYQFGAREDPDGATALLTSEEVRSEGVWSNLIQIGNGYDLSTLSRGVMPKLYRAGTTSLMEFQPDVPIQPASAGQLIVKNVDLVTDTTGNRLRVEFNLINHAWTDDEMWDAAWEQLADWSTLQANGAVVTILDDRSCQAGVGPRGETGWVFYAEYNYEDEAAGHYLDSYITTLNVYTSPDKSAVESVQTKVSLRSGVAVYKEIASMNEWNAFFQNRYHALAYENICLVSNADTYSYEFNADSQICVRLNRLTNRSPQGAEISGLISTGKTGVCLVTNCTTEISNIHFRNLTVSTTYGSGYNNTGIVNVCQGDVRSCTFENVTMNLKSANYAGIVGNLYGTMEDLTAYNLDINITSSYSGSYIGGFAGYAYTTSVIRNCELTGGEGDARSCISAPNGNQVGGIVGYFFGQVENVAVNNTDVYARYMVGGVAGYMSSGNAGHEGEYRMKNVVVGASFDADGEIVRPANDSAEPGVLREGGKRIPSVRISTEKKPSGSNAQYIGGVIGYCYYSSTSLATNLNAYNVEVYVPTRNPSDSGASSIYSYYVGGIIGYYAYYCYDSTAENCTVTCYGSYVGGVAGSGSGRGNTAKECVVTSLADYGRYVGGVYGTGHPIRALAQHCIVSGHSNVGGISGYCDSSFYQNGVTDCIIIGDTQVGGLVGSGGSSYSNCFVSASNDGYGDPSVTTVLREEMFPLTGGALAERVGKTMTGTMIFGDTSVGGMLGVLWGTSIANSYVGSGVYVSGEKNVGGICGKFYGWYTSATGSSRTLANCAMGADVHGETNVGGLIGLYTRAHPNKDDKETKVATAFKPTTGQFYANLITGDVTGTLGKAGVLIGTMDTWKEDDEANVLETYSTLDETEGTMLAYCRIYEGSHVSGFNVAGLPKLSEAPASQHAKLLTVSAENLADENTYFAAKGTSAYQYGMAWNRSYWTGDSLQTFYVNETNTAADFDTYSSGIEKDGLVLWLDGRNNTGAGYTDEDSYVWKDLSASGNDAKLYFNNKSPVDGEVLFIDEAKYYMNWRNGGLEWRDSTSAYYAKLNKTLSDYLNDGEYTVELVLSLVNPTYSGAYLSALSWYDGVRYGGWRSYFGSSGSTLDLAYSFNATGALSAWSMSPLSGKQVTTPVNSTTSYVIHSSAAGTSADPSRLFYTNGAQTGYYAAKAAQVFPEDCQWRIGYGYAGNTYMHVSGVRVYNRALTADEIRQNAAYDEWYYHGGEKPASAQAKGPTITWGSGSYMLMCSPDYGYNGALRCSDYTGNGSELSRGYWYLTDGEGHYSSILSKTGVMYLPRLKVTSVNNEVYGGTPYEFLRGQEGEDVNGNIYDCDDGVFMGGYVLPDAGSLTRTLKAAEDMPDPLKNPNSGLDSDGIPGMTAYASGIGTVNLELYGDAPNGLLYTVSDGEGTELLSGEWPQDSRVLTMTWDYATTFTVTLCLGENTQEHSYGYTALARTVMTRNNGYWYLFGSECINAADESVASDSYPCFIHMMDGLLLDDGGTVYDAETGKVCGSLPEAFTLTAAKPVWCGTVALDSGNVAVESFGTCFISEGGCKDTQLVVRKGAAYTMPGSEVKVGSFVVDTYNGAVYDTVLGTDGVLTDLGTPLVYPEDFSNAGIREISSNLYYGGHTVLVRYNSGKLAAFDYLTGAVCDVRSSENRDVSVFEFLLEELRNIGSGPSLLSGGAQQALRAAAYQEEVDADPSLRTALANLIANEENTAVVNGEGSGVYAENAPGGLDGELAFAGQDASNGTEASAEAGGEVHAGEAEAESSETAAVGETAEAPADDRGAADNAPAGSGSTAVPERAVTGEWLSAPAADTPEEVSTRFVSVYQPAQQAGAVYDLEELLTKPADEIVTQEVRAKQLESMGFRTRTLTSQRAAVKEESHGLTLMILTAAAALALLVVMAILRRRKLDVKPAENTRRK